MRRQDARDPAFVGLEDGWWATLFAHRTEDCGDSLALGLGELEAAQKPRKSLVSPAGPRATFAKRGQVDAAWERARGDDLDAIGKDRDSGWVEELVAPMGERVDHGLAQRALWVLERVGRFFIALVKGRIGLGVQKLGQAAGLVDQRSRELVAFRVRDAAIGALFEMRGQ